MSYIEERIKYLAVKRWQNDKSKHELTCGNPECDGKSWGGTITAHFERRKLEGDLHKKCYLMCEDCGYEQDFVPKPVIDAFLDRI